jgi:hypothetical protein
MERWGSMSTYYRNTKPIQVNPVSAGEMVSTPTGFESLPTAPSLNEQGGETVPDNPDIRATGIMENLDPMKSRIRNPASRKKWAIILRRIIKLINRKVFRVLTNEERAAEEEQARRQALFKQLMAEAKVAERRMTKRLAGLGLCYIKKGVKGEARETQLVRFRRVLFEPDALWFQVDVEHLPYQVSIAQLIDQDVVNNLSVSVGHKVMARWTELAGVWYVIERASGMMGIPNHVNLEKMWEGMPASKNALTIPIGLTNNGRAVYESMDDMTHLLIAGTTGGGKSNFLNVILCTLIRRNTPARLQLLLVDLKGGLEFNFYEGVPHLCSVPVIAPKGVIYERDEVAPLIRWVIQEGEKRMSILREAGCKNIGEYNHHRKKGYMKHMIFVVDEWADVRLLKDGKKTCEEELTNAVQRMRAVGIHCIICTQVPQREVLGTMIKANIPAKFAFNFSDIHGSMAIINSGHAANLQPKGRCIYKFENEVQVQTPFIPKTLILSTVNGAITGCYEETRKAHDVTPEEVRDWAIRDNNGWLTVGATFSQFKQRGLSKEELIGWLQAWEEQEFLIGSSLYKVAAGEGSRGRRLVVVEDPPEEKDKAACAS